MKKILLVLLLIASTANAWDQYSGWWYDPDRPGTGVSLEIRGEVLFAALYSYDLKGNPIWMSSPALLSLEDGNATYKGPLQFWTGWPFNGEYSAPSKDDIGDFKISFITEDTAVMTFKTPTQVGLITTVVHLKKFMPDVSPGALDPRDINGWWYDPDYNGMGFFLEARGGTAFIAWYHYDNLGISPQWHSCYTDFNATDTSLQCVLNYWHDGSPIGIDPYKSPERKDLTFMYMAGFGGPVTLTYDGKTYHLERFDFINPECKKEGNLNGTWGVTLDLNGTSGALTKGYALVLQMEGESSGNVTVLPEGHGTFDYIADEVSIRINTTLGGNATSIELYGDSGNATDLSGTSFKLNDKIYHSYWHAQRSRYCTNADPTGIWMVTLHPSGVKAAMVVREDGSYDSPILDPGNWTVDGDMVFFYAPEQVMFGRIHGQYMDGIFDPRTSYYSSWIAKK